MQLQILKVSPNIALKMPGAKIYLLVVLAVSSYFLQDAGAWITDPVEVDALKAIKRSLVDPMKNLITWNIGDPCTSNWTGIFCSTAVNDGYLHVEELQLLKLNLSGSLAPELGHLSHLKILDYMRNNISGSIPKEIGNITSLKLLLLSGNQLSGSLPDEIGYLPNLNRLQIDENEMTGPIPISFANLSNMKHLHMNNNSISGQVPPELSRLSILLHLLLDNNNLSGYLPPEFSRLPNLKILQFDNNNFIGRTIPASYGNITTLVKLSVRNCSLQGSIPDFSRMHFLGYLDLSWNKLIGPIPSNSLSVNITTIDLSNNFLNGSIPSSFTGLPNLQRLSLGNNALNGSVPPIWQNMTFNGNKSLILDFQHNSLTNVANTLNLPPNVTLLLYGNPICTNVNQLVASFCQFQIINLASGSTKSSKTYCPPCPTELDYENNPLSPNPCSCSVALGIGFRLKSPGISDFRPYIDAFKVDLTSLLDLYLYQLSIQLYVWEKGPRLNMYLKLFPDKSSLFNASEILRIRRTLAGWKITLSDVFGPYELLNFTLGSYSNVVPMTTSTGLSKGAIVGILLGSITGAVILSAFISVLFMRRRLKNAVGSKGGSLSKTQIKIDNVKGFTFQEMALATNNFSNSALVGHGGYGKVYKGILADGAVVAIKRSEAGSLQGSKEFSTEIELLSRLHHRHLVSLLGYCDEDDEQMLVYEFMPNGTLRDHLSAKSKDPLNFSMRLRISLEMARGLLYLHTEADPPIFHRDIKASNILLDSKYVAKVADFGLSRLAPTPNIEGVLPDHVSTVVKGTPGYLDPEYFLTHKLTDKSDVYSLGVVFLELLTGMHPISHGKNIVREVSLAFRSGKTFSVIDSRMGSYPSECIERFVSLAFRCCHDETDARPSMSEVVRELENIWRMMPEADTMSSEYTFVERLNTAMPSSLSSTAAYPYLSSDASGSDLSGVAQSITPR